MRQQWRNKQKKIEDIENKIKSIEEGKQVGRSWADIIGTPEKKTLEKVAEKQLRERENEEKDTRNRRNNIIIFGCPESESNVAENNQRNEKDIKQIVAPSRNICQINIGEEAISKAIRLGK